MYGIYYLNHLLCVSILSLSLNTCAIFIGGTITTASLFIYKSIMFNTTIHVVIQPSGFMVLDFHWKYMSYFHLLFCFTYFIVLSMKNKYTIPHRTVPYRTILYHLLNVSVLAVLTLSIT